MSGFGKVDIIYPFKNDLDSPSRVLDILTTNSVKKQPPSVGEAGVVSSNRESLESSISTSTTYSTSTVEVQDRSLGYEVPNENVSVDVSNQKGSVWQKIKGWFLALYDLL